MEKFIIVEGKTYELAVETALEQLHLDRDSVSVEILEKEKSGFLGIGSKPAKVKVTYEGPAENNAPALSSASRSKPKKPAEKKPEKKPEPQRAPEKKPEMHPERKAEKKPAAKQPEKKAAPRDYAPAAPGSMEETIETFLKGLLEHMGNDAVPHAWKEDSETYRADLVGDNLGALIGRRGDTLDAIQHLTNYVINRGGNKRIRVNVDAEGYRAKREDALRHLALKVAGKVTKYRRNITLEPMNAYERHVIHAALQDVENVTTYSTGSEPNRRVVVVFGDTQDEAED
ncbi:MAG: protein jag [Oscillospiraceae bacterium]|nr:protein jag [Oscillospiraceae bacterium]